MISFSIRNPLIVNLMVALVMIAGVLSWHAMPQEMFPTVEHDKVRILTEFEGASPEEVERQITLPIEEEFDGLPDIDAMSSTSNEGISNILIKLKTGSDVDDFMRDARSTLDQVTDLPGEAEEPDLSRLETRYPVISLSVYGDVQRGHLYDLADRVRRQLAQLPGVASVNIAGKREWELWVIVDPQVLSARDISLETVSRGLRDNLRDLPGGSLKSTEGEIRLRGRGVAPDPEAMARIRLRSNVQGGQLRLGDVAKVKLRLEQARTLGRFNSKPSVNLTVSKTAQASTIEVAETVRNYVEELRTGLPTNINCGLFSDLSIIVKTRLDTVKSSGLVGLALVLLALYLMLNFRVALITAIGIPMSFLVSVVLIHYLGYSINMVSLFAFFIALGLIVDDAIIVTENIYRHRELGASAATAARLGAQQVFWPVMASTGTTVAAFMPMFVIGGTMGAFISVIPVVVATCLMGSLIETFGVLPSHAKEWLRIDKNNGKKRWIDSQRLRKRYGGALHWSLDNRYFVAILAGGLLVITLVYAATRIPFLLFGDVAVGQFFVNVETPNTYDIEDSLALTKQMEHIILETLDEDEIDTLLSNVGITFVDFQRVRLGSRYIQLIVDLKKRRHQGFIDRFISPLVSLRFDWEGSRERSADEIIDQLRAKLGQLPGIYRLSVLRPQGGPGGGDIEIGLAGDDVNTLHRLGGRIRDYIARLPGVSDVRHDMDRGKLEYRYELNERGRQLGLTQAQLAAAVRTGFLGQKVLHVNWRNKRIPVRLIYPDVWRHSAQGLEQLLVTLENGTTVFLKDVADVVQERGFNTINRRDMRRLATLTAEINSNMTTPDEVIELVRQKFVDLPNVYPGYELLFLGQKKDASESVADLKRAMVIALALIFFILVALFKSLLDPLVVMFAIPFGVIGVIVGHILFGYHMQFMSLIGFLALAGIVVNDSLILVDFAKRLKNEGWNLVDALVEAAQVRLRPILLTSITTFLGISPLIFFATGQTAFLSPLAVSLGFGLIFSTVLVLLALPCFYLIADDLRQWTSHKTRRWLGIENTPAPSYPLGSVEKRSELVD